MTGAARKQKAQGGRRRGATGPAAFVTAAFIGPGTLLTCARAGAGFGYALLWALLFAMIATAVLQEMSGRASLASGRTLSQQIRGRFRNPAARGSAAVLIIAAISCGCAAYQSGNLCGGGVGVGILFPELAGSTHLAAGGLGLIAGFFLFFSGYRWVETVLKTMVIVMSLSFAAAAVLSGPRIVEILRGAFIPTLPEGSALVALGLVGTTVVPYNLFLYSRVVHERFQGKDDIPAMRRDLYIYLAVGGLVSSLITITAAAVLAGTTQQLSPERMPELLEPALGRWAVPLFGAGLLAAGFSSALTAPLAGAYVVTGLFNTSMKRTGRLFRAAWMTILGTGIFFAVRKDLDPGQVIVAAQVINGLLLPLVIVFLIVAVNARGLGQMKNGLVRNIAAAIIVLITAALGVKTVASFF